MTSVMGTAGDVTDSTARAALAHVAAGRCAAAQRVTTPWWFHPLLGTTVAASLASLSLRGPGVAVALVLAQVAQAALYALYRRLTGLWIDTVNVDGMRWVTAAAITVSTLLCMLGIGLEHYAGVRGAAAITGVVLGVVYVIYWRWVERRLIVAWTALP